MMESLVPKIAARHGVSERYVWSRWFDIRALIFLMRVGA